MKWFAPWGGGGGSSPCIPSSEFSKATSRFMPENELS